MNHQNNIHLQHYIVMKSILILITFLCYCTFSATAGELKVAQTVELDTDIDFEYAPNKDDSFSKPYVLIYAFSKSNVKPIAYQVELNKDNKAHFGVPKETVFLLYKVSDGKNTDDNGSQFWQTIITNKGKPVQNAYFRVGISYLGQLPENCRRATSAIKAEENLAMELREHGDNVLAKAGLAMLNYDSKKLTKEQFEQKILSIFSESNLDWEQEEITRSAWRSFKAIGNIRKSDSIAKYFVRKYPKSELAEDYGLDYLRTLNEEGAIIDSAFNYLNRFPDTKDASMLAQGMAPMAASKSRLYELMELYSSKKLRNPFVVSLFAFILVDSDSTRIKYAIDYITKESKLLQKTGTDAFKSRWLAPLEWTELGASLFTQLKATRGFLYERAGSKKDAIADLEDVTTNNPQTCHEVIFDKLISLLYENKYDMKKAYFWASRAIELSKATENVRKIHKETFAFSDNADKVYEKVLIDLKASSSESRRNNLKKTMLRQNAPEGTLTTLQGQKVTMSSLRGKTIVLDFWATWCGPCRASFPAMQKLYSIYKNDESVVFIIANCWEKGDDKKKVVTDFLTKNNYTFPVYFDDGDSLAKSFGVTGIPAKFFISPKGQIQFKESGFQGEEKFLEEGTDKIELLKKDI